MARIRSIKPEFWASESLGTRLRGPEGRQARLLFIALWNHAEDHGVCRGAPALLRSVAFPYDDDVTHVDVARWVGLLVDARLVVRYDRDGSTYLWVRGFAEHQKIDRKSKTTLPEPSQQERDGARRTREPSRQPQEDVKQETKPASSPRRALDEHSLQDGKGEDGKGEDLLPPTPQGAREPREGDPCEEHHPPRAAPAAAQLAQDSFAAEPAPPVPGVWELHAAIQAVYEQVRPGKKYPWDPRAERKSIQTLWERCGASGITDLQQQVQEVAKRFGRGLACADDGKGRAQFTRCCSSLTGLAKPECWAGNDVPFVAQREVRDLDGKRRLADHPLEPWAFVTWRAAA
jgi:hypothetical protein